MGNNTNSLHSSPTRSIDGFSRGISSRHHVAPHKPQQAKTLMRSAVKKPQIMAPSSLKAQTRTDVLARVPNHVITPKLSHSQVHPNRLKKAEQMIKNPIVSRFNTAASNTTPAHTVALSSAPEKLSMSEFRSLASRVDQTAQTKELHVSPMRSYAPTEDMLQRAIAQATAHEETYDEPKKARGLGKFAALLTGSFGLLLIAGFIAYNNVPSISMKLAASRAGVQAKLPNYSPAGFSFGSLSYGPGNVTVNYKADSGGNGKFAITEQVSEWDSQALLTNYVATANKAYQTYERAGRTIYFFGNNTATWVDNGIWYTVDGNNTLTKNQLLDLAGSM